MNQHPTITIVTPSYNQGKYIEETIQSVLSQEGDFFIDYIVTDGGSTDNTIEILKKYDTMISVGSWKHRCLGITFHWESEKDRGQTHAINKGIKKAKGDILSYINSDDMYFEKAFSTVVSHFLKNNDDDFVYGDGDVIDENSNLLWEWFSRPYRYSLLKSYHYLWNDFTNYIMQQTVFWRAGVINKIGLFDESFHYAMDVEYWIRAGAAGLKLKHIPVKLGKFRMIKGTKSLSSPTVFWSESLEIFRRFNGSRRMEPFLRYYFYNEGLHNGFNIDSLSKKKQEILTLWKHLGIHEFSILEKISEKSLLNAYLMLAYRASLNGERKIALLTYKRAVVQRPWYILHYLSLWFLLNKFIGTSLSKHLQKFTRHIIHIYRMRRYLYRYIHN
jgi:glycosyltransferase involved in cell wall biosynthesis